MLLSVLPLHETATENSHNPKIVTVSMNCYRYLDENTCEMTCTLNIAETVVKVPLGYRYVVYSSRMTEEKDCFEYVHCYLGQDSQHNRVHRCLRIDFNSVNKSMYFIFTFMHTLPILEPFN